MNAQNPGRFLMGADVDEDVDTDTDTDAGEGAGIGAGGILGGSCPLGTLS